MLKPFSLALLVTLLAACGGGGGGAGDGPQVLRSLSLTGTAATGAAIAGGTVQARCRSGTGTATTDADGRFSVEVAGGVLPCMLKAVDPVSELELHSVVEEGASSTNITPATELVTAHLLGHTPAQAFADLREPVLARISSERLSVSMGAVQQATAALGADADMRGVDIMKGSLSAATELKAGDANDRKIDALMAALAAADRRIRELTDVLKAAPTADAAAGSLRSLVGDAVHALPNCPQARSGPVWVFGMTGGPPLAYTADFRTMQLTRQSTNAVYEIRPVRDGAGREVACAFSSEIGGVRYEYRISEGGLILAQTVTGGALVLPAQKSHKLTDTGFAGAYPAMAFIQAKNSSLRLAVPVRFELDAAGKMTGYACDLTKSVPDCLTEVSPSNKDDIACASNADGTFSCSSATTGFQATVALYLTGSQATMVMSIANMNIANAAYQGMIVLTKAGRSALPPLGLQTPAGASWILSFSDSTARSSESLASTVTAVDAASLSFSTRSVGAQGSPVSSEHFLDKPARGFVYSHNSASKSIALRSPAGWALSAHKRPEDPYYANWTASIRMSR